MACTNLDLILEAVFLWIVYILAALSIALYAFGKSAWASATFLPETNFLISLVNLETASPLRTLNTLLRTEALYAFFADEVIAIRFTAKS